MNHENAIKTILSYSRPGMSFDLKRIQKLNKLLSMPDLKTKFVHVAGTNGKGSTSTMIASILTEAGYKVGLFTSPGIKNFNERIKINGQDISDEDLKKISKKIKPLIKFMEEPPTEFELITAIALEYFDKNRCDIVVLEVGLGGNLDATNVISKKEVAVITHIGFDHEHILGNTLESIANEKSGIIKPNCDVVVYSQDPKIHKIIEKKCSTMKINLQNVDFENIETIKTSLKGQYFKISKFPNLFLPILGAHQQKNACVAIETINFLIKRGFKVSKKNIYSGLKNLKIHSRFEVIKSNPIIIFDGAHNLQAFEMLYENLNTIFNEKIIFIIGVLKDKNYKSMMKVIKPIAEKIYTITPSCERALDSLELCEFLKTLNIDVYNCEDLSHAINRATTELSSSSSICITGSLYIRKMFF